jgi:hypothetical protein
LATFLVYFTPWFFFLGVIAIALSLIALWAIRNAEGTLTGTTFAYIGLSSAAIALVSIAVFWASYQYGVRREADQFFRLWFAAVQRGDIPLAKEYRSIYSQRSRAVNADEWWQEQYAGKYAHWSVHRYVEDKLIRVLMALGDDAKVTYYQTSSVHSDRESDVVTSVYAVTFPREFHRTETFFVRIIGKRVHPSSQDFRSAGWKIEESPSVYVPEEFKIP